MRDVNFSYKGCKITKIAAGNITIIDIIISTIVFLSPALDAEPRSILRVGKYARRESFPHEPRTGSS